MGVIWSYLKKILSSVFGDIVNQILAEDNKKVRAENEQLREDKTALTAARDDARKELGETKTSLEAEKAVTGEYKQREEAVRKRTHQIVTGMIWRCPPTHAVPDSRERAEGMPPIIAIVNLKGGVGKTTIAANLAANYWNGDKSKNVLLLDLDYQGSLTLHCLRHSVATDLCEGRRTTSELLAVPGSGRGLDFVKQRIENWNAFIVAADETFQDIEMKELAEWVYGMTNDDVRFRLRSILHTEAVQKDHSAIILDCPPRLTLGCVNALAACDYVLIPVVADAVSVISVARTVTHLKNLRDAGVCPKLEILGLVRNKSDKWQNAEWYTLGTKCEMKWGATVRLFSTFVPDTVRFPKALANDELLEDRFLSLGRLKENHDLRDIFAALRQEIDSAMSEPKAEAPPAA